MYKVLEPVLLEKNKAEDKLKVRVVFLGLCVRGCLSKTVQTRGPCGWGGVGGDIADSAGMHFGQCGGGEQGT